MNIYDSKFPNEFSVGDSYPTDGVSINDPEFSVKCDPWSIENADTEVSMTKELASSIGLEVSFAYTCKYDRACSNRLFVEAGTLSDDQ